MKKSIIVISWAAVMMTGCASTPNHYQYNANKSRAYNLAQAGGLYGAKDYDVPESQREGFTSQAWDVADDALLFNSPDGLALDWDASIGLGILTTAFAPAGPMERDSVFAWVPQTQAANQGEAWSMMSTTLLGGIEDALKQANMDYVVDLLSLDQSVLMSEYKLSSVRIIEPEHGCPDWEAANQDLARSCYAVAKVHAPTDEPVTIPAFVLPDQKGYAFFANDDTEYSRLEIHLPDESDFDRNALLAAVSQELPPWTFVFLASESRGNGQYSAPLILSQGKPTFFIAPVSKDTVTH